MKRPPISAARRIVIIGLGSYALATLLLGTGIFLAMHAAFSRQIDARIAQTSMTLQSEFSEDGVRGVVKALRQRKMSGPDALGFALFDGAGHRAAGDLVVALPAPGWQTIQFADPDEGADPARALVSDLGGGYRLVVAEDLTPLEEIDQTILAMFGLAFVALMGLGWAGLNLLARFLRQRLRSISQTADAIIAGDLACRADLGMHDDEFDRVAASLNAMLDRIAELIANLRQVTGDLAHDLRTPLSRLRHQLEALGAIEDAAQRRKRVEAAIANADEVLALFDAILRISEVEEGGLRPGFAAIDVSALIVDLGETLAPLVEESRRLLKVACEPELRVMGNRELLAQAVINLIENARRHTPEGAAIELRAGRRDDTVVICVADNGPGIPACDRERVQQRFVRLEASRSTPGHGLGLALVRAIARAHDASLALSDARPGLIAEIHLPSSCGVSQPSINSISRSPA
ncbi:MAG TPA: HAMP domain-containing sensor histidine kinase [Novosphingobium sp.]|nr:HAMP domain-containing sensor histidine kinase [Novosphingobium sp.]